MHAVLDMEAEVPPAEQLPDAATEAIFEVCTAASEGTWHALANQFDKITTTAGVEYRFLLLWCMD